MQINKAAAIFLRSETVLSYLANKNIRKCYHGVPFLNLYKKVTGEVLSSDKLLLLQKKHPTLQNVSQSQIDYVLKILEKFGITAQDACNDPHLFCMNAISMDNYGEILRECCFVNILPKYIIRYHTLVKSRTIANLKKDGILRENLNLEEVLYDCFKDWPKKERKLNNFSDKSTSILTVRTSVLEKYLNWRLSVTEDEFKSYCKNYLPLRHRPMCDITEALHLAQDVIKFDVANIRRNGFIISSDPVNTKLIIENVDSLAGYNIVEAIRMEPAILKNNYNSLLEIREILKDYGINEEAQRRCLRVYCMRAQTVRERLDQLRELKEYQILSSHPRVLSMVVHKRKMLTRLEKIQSAKKQCYSLNNLVSSRKVFNNYINGFGNKVCGRDMAILIASSIRMREEDINSNSTKLKEDRYINLKKAVLKQLKKHKYWLHSSLYIINENLQYLNKKFYGEVIVNNCQILLYPLAETQRYMEYFLMKRNHTIKANDIDLDGGYNNLNYTQLTDDQILSLALYEIEKRYHFSGDGIWSFQEGAKDTQTLKQQSQNN
ncbi:transcription termination factor 5, mitochondrial [Papilio machaon]|uniref:transcription termination factor 5, mitochondrial n=1 Tax=Papilio machaon TaxID=76193 RepID=UPI001E663CA9|nr:transcription termination factor 5, mitochondrial [Papilio machaon]